jgi:hypothetical protein
MISMQSIDLGAPRCPEAAHLGSGAKAVFGRNRGVNWVIAVAVSPTDQGTRVSAARERSP